MADKIYTACTLVVHILTQNKPLYFLTVVQLKSQTIKNPDQSRVSHINKQHKSITSALITDCP